MGGGGLEGAGAHVEFLGELVGGEIFAGEENLLRVPSLVVGEEDIERIGGRGDAAWVLLRRVDLACGVNRGEV